MPLTIDEYLRKKLMPVEGVIPHLPGIDMYGNTIPDEIVGGDVFEYINFQQRYNIEARIHQAEWLAKEVLDRLLRGSPCAIPSMSMFSGWRRGPATRRRTESSSGGRRVRSS